MGGLITVLLLLLLQVQLNSLSTAAAATHEFRTPPQLLAAPLATATQSQPFVNGVGGWRMYRIPSMLHLTNGDLLLFCEARGPEHGIEAMPWTTDGGPTDVVTRRSTDLGRTWSSISIVHSETTPARVVTIGNPSPVALSSDPNTIVLTFWYAKTMRIAQPLLLLLLLLLLTCASAGVATCRTPVETTGMSLSLKAPTM